MKLDITKLTIKEFLAIINKKVSEVEGKKYGKDNKGNELPSRYDIISDCVKDIIAEPLTEKDGFRFVYSKDEYKHRELPIFQADIEIIEDKRFKWHGKGTIKSVVYKPVEFYECYKGGNNSDQVAIPAPDENMTVENFMYSVMLTELNYRLAHTTSQLNEAQKTLQYWQDSETDIKFRINKIEGAVLSA
jgi:hypothetical protein